MTQTSEKDDESYWIYPVVTYKQRRFFNGY